MGWLFSPYGLSVVLKVIALIHYFRNRPEWYWFFVIIFLPFGSIIYLFVEILPGWNWKLPAFERLERSRRKRWLERVVADSPTQDALSELAAITRSSPSRRAPSITAPRTRTCR